jgi:hypothetical protein
VFVQRLWLIHGDALAFNPGVSFKFFIVLANADPQFGSNALPAQQPPKRKGFFQATRVTDIVSDRCTHHAHRQINTTGHRGIIFFARG